MLWLLIFAFGVVIIVRAVFAVAEDYRVTGFPYRTVFRRIAAGAIDVLLFLPLSLATWWVWNNVTAPSILVPCFILQSFSGVTYSILLHGLYGQTVGKWMTGVKVMSVSGAKLSMRQAILRDFVVLISAVYGFAIEVPRVASGMRPFDVESTMGERFHYYVFSLWIILELVTMLLNHKRRAIHDFIASSVVIRLDAAALGGVEGSRGD